MAILTSQVGKNFNGMAPDKKSRPFPTTRDNCKGEVE